MAMPPPDVHTVMAENAALRAENAMLKAELAQLKASANTPAASPAMVPPPQFYPSPYGYAAPPPAYGATSAYGSSYGYPGYPPPAAPAAPAQRRATLPMNAENKRGPKGANLALFCIPNSYQDENVYELCKGYGKVIFCSVASHRDTGMSRGYAFVSYDTVAEADAARSSLHDHVVEGRALRCELARSDKEGTTASKPY